MNLKSVTKLVNLFFARTQDACLVGGAKKSALKLSHFTGSWLLWLPIVNDSISMTALRTPSTGKNFLTAEKSAQKNFGLSPEAFEEMRDAFVDGNRQLLERVFLAHFENCMDYMMTHDKVTKLEAYDATMAAMVRFSELLIAGKIEYGNLRYLFTRMARQSYQTTVRRQRIFTELPADAALLADELPEFPDEEFSIMARSFKLLGADCQELLKKFYYKNLTLKEIAERQDRAATAVRKQKSRCVARLKKYFYIAS